MATTTKKAILRRMLQIDQSLGRSEAVTGLAAQTATAATLAVGGSSQQYVNEWLFRQDTATAADRIRRVTSFAPTTGVLTHAGAAYTDTTVGSELLEVLKFSPHLYDAAIQVTLARLKHNSRTIIPTLANQDTAWLADLDWVRQPADILRVTRSTNPVLTRNRYFQDYPSYDSAGVLKPDFWTLTGAGASMARSTAQKRRGLPHTLAITRAGTDCYISQAPGLLENGVSADSLRSKSVTFVFVVRSAVASQVRASIYDGTTTTNGAFHTGGGGFEEITITATIGANASTVEGRLNVITDNTVVNVSEGYGLEGTETNDSVRRDNYDSTEEEIPRRQYEQSGTLNATLPPRARGGQWVVWSQRGYPQLDATRFAAGTADADVIDAPELAVATGAIGRLYESLIDPQNPETGPKYGPLAALWNERFDSAAGSHMSPDDGPQHLGALSHRLLMNLAPPARRY